MNTVDDGSKESGPQRMQDFIFARELAEVYLLLDHLSGRSDKSLAEAIGEGVDKTGAISIGEICKIGFPPEGTAVEQAAQAATLLMAKDKLNFAAKPANGASIAFTLLVAGDDDETAAQEHRTTMLGRWWRRLAFWRTAQRPPKSDRDERGQGPAPMGPPGDHEDRSGLPETGAGANAPPTGPGGPPGNSTPGVGRWGGGPPSRTSLARLAYPGLVSTAARFNRRIKQIIVFLFGWLIFTCVLSWNIAAGHAMLVRLDAVEAAKIAIQKRIADAELEDVKRLAAPGSSDGTSTAPSNTALAPVPKPPVQRYCDPPRLPPTEKSPTGASEAKIALFRDVTQRQICDDATENRTSLSISREDIADWLAPWGWQRGISHFICGGPCVKAAVELPADAMIEKEWTVVLIQVLATAVLPLCYGFLGAGAAVVRNIWSKMKDSLLSPRDLTLSLGQLALGAVIGASIGLFVNPSGPSAQSAVGLTTGVTLTPSALSFIAGFGVEGVFVAMESLIKRLFNIPDPKP